MTITKFGNPATKLLLTALTLTPVLGEAHGIVGKRYFPTTIATEDPVVADELAFRVGHIKEAAEGDEPRAVATEIEGEYSKRIGRRFAVKLGGQYVNLDLDGEPSERGFGNLEVGLRYQAYTNPEREAVISVELEAEVGGIGNADIGAQSHSVISPGILFGKGFGELEGQRLQHFKPFAITGSVAANFPTDSHSGEERNPVTVSTGLALFYDLKYFDQHVSNGAMPAFLNRLIPLVELSLDTCVNRGCDGEVSGSVNPGFLWVSQHLHLGLAADIPVNERSGDNVGVLGLLQFSLDHAYPSFMQAAHPATPHH